MPGARCGTSDKLDLDARAGASGGFASRAGQARRAHVLNAGDGVGGEQFQAGFADQFFHERIAHLHRAALLAGGFLGQIARGEGRARQAVATRGRADVKDRDCPLPWPRRARSVRGAGRRGKKR